MRIAQLFLMAVIFVLLWFALHHRSSTEAKSISSNCLLGANCIDNSGSYFPRHVNRNRKHIWNWSRR